MQNNVTTTLIKYLIYSRWCSFRYQHQRNSRFGKTHCCFSTRQSTGNVPKISCFHEILFQNTYFMSTFNLLKQSMCFKEVSSRILDKLPKQEGVRWQWSTSISHVQQTMYQQQLMANIKTCFSLLWCSGLLHSNKKFPSSLVSQWNLHECWVLMHNKDGRQWF